jgi:hypothetical protein
VTKAKILYVSLGNIVIVGEKRILADWELHKRIGKSPEDASYEKVGLYFSQCYSFSSQEGTFPA